VSAAAQTGAFLVCSRNSADVTILWLREAATYLSRRNDAKDAPKPQAAFPYRSSLGYWRQKPAVLESEYRETGFNRRVQE